MKRLALVLTILGACPALAQQPPDPVFLQRALVAMQAQRNAAMDDVVALRAQLEMARDDLAKAQAQIKELDKKPEPAK